MSQLKNFINEIHRRSLWQVLAIYIAVAWVVLQAVEVLTSSYGLPAWFPALAAALLLMGLPFVLATAFVQEGAPGIRRSDPTLLPETSDPILAAAPAGLSHESQGVRSVFNWRNAILIGAALFAIWGVISTIWLFTGFRGLVVKAEAADLFEAKDAVVVADFENSTDQPALGLAVTEAVITDLDQSEYVTVVERSELAEVLERMRLPDTTSLSADIAVEVAQREGYPVVVSGSVTPLGNGYQISARIIEATTGDVAVRLRETAMDEAEVIPAVERLARLTRRHLGESLTSLQRSQPLPNVTTASLEALELYSQGRALLRRGDAASAIPLMERAVRVDTAFASAYRGLSVAYSNVGNTGAGQTNAEKAFRHADRLVDLERYMTGGTYHSWRRQLDSATYYYQRVLDREPENFVAVNNLGDLYERMGRYEDALRLYRISVDIDPTSLTGHLNMASAAATLSEYAVAESAMVVMRERFPGAFATNYFEFSLAQYTGDFDQARAGARLTADMPSPVYNTWGYWLLTGAEGTRGHIDAALAFADTSMRMATEAGSLLPLYLALQTVEHIALAAGQPERITPFLEPVFSAVADDPSPTFKHLGLAFIAQGQALTGELNEARATLARMDSLAASGDFRPYGAGERVRALIALLEERPEESLEYLNRSRAADFSVRFRGERLLRGDAYAALGQLAEAAAQYDTLTISYELDFRDVGIYGPLKALAHERAGAVYLALGDSATAARHLAAFAELWNDADPALQPRVESAVRTLALLAGEGN
jgi:tetratricopeptide (TPR) repeat protein